MSNFDYNQKKLEQVACNICGNTDVKIIVRKSVNNLKANTVMCKRCSLVYINPRMTEGDYDEYYMTHYRVDRAAIKNKEYVNDLEKNFQNARRFGKAIIKYMGEFVHDGLTVDVGSSTGGILYGMREMKNGLELLGIEPSVDESNYANQKGVKTTRGLFEQIDIDLKNKVSNILCVQSLNHLLDPKKFMDWSHEALKDGGHIFLAVKNWRHQVRRMGKLSSGVQIDHVYMFTPETLKLLCLASGFEVVYMDVDEGKSQEAIKKQKEDGLSTHHIRIVGKKFSKNTNLKFKKSTYWKARIQLSPILVKMVYLLKYSGRFAIIRKILHI